MSFGVFVLGLLVIVSSLLVPNSACSCHDWMFLSKSECEFKSRNWWIAYLVMFLGAVIAVYGGSS